MPYEEMSRERKKWRITLAKESEGIGAADGRVPKCRHIVAVLLAIVARRSHSIHLLRAASLSRYTHTHTHDTTCTQQNMESSSSSERENYLHFNKSIFLLRFSLLFYFLFTFFSFNLHLVCLLLLCQHIATPFSFSFLDSIRRVE